MKTWRTVVASIPLALAFSPAFAGTEMLSEEASAARAAQVVGESRGAGPLAGNPPVVIVGNAAKLAKALQAPKGLPRRPLRLLAANVPGISLRGKDGSPQRSRVQRLNDWNRKHPVISVLIPLAMGAAIGVGVTGTPLGALIGLIGGTAALIKVFILKRTAR